MLTTNTRPLVQNPTRTACLSKTPLLFAEHRPPYGGTRAEKTFRLCLGDGTERSLGAPLSVGSGVDNDWVIADPHVSRHHLLLAPDGNFIRVTDRGSANGTYVFGVRIEQAVLGEGARLRFGATEMRVLSSEESTPLLGECMAMQTLRHSITRLAPTELPVLIQGESGTGKEVVASAIHRQSGRKGPLIPLNCGALPRELIESELFGHERGAFTGANAKRVGCIAEAQGGTLFLDEIAELPLELQPRLLRALESKAIRPLGSNREVPVDVRIVAATHSDLERAVGQGRFREDLYYRLAGFELHVPPLRERAEDIPLLVRHFLAQQGGGLVSISDQELREVSRYHWPGNVRQLRNAVSRAIHLGGPRLVATDLVPQGGTQGACLPKASGVSVLGRRFQDIEREVFETVLKHEGYNRRAAAAHLGLPKSTFFDKIRRMGIG